MFRHLSATAFAVLVASCAPTAPGPLRTVPKVDLSRYSGKWYEIARFPQWFQRGCVSATAEYSKNPDGTIKVVNTCIRADGSKRSITGSAVAVDEKANRLGVRFSESWIARFIPVPQEGNYWIIDVSPDYQNAIVGTPDRRFLWFLSRDATISNSDLNRMRTTAEREGFDTNKLVLDGHTRVFGK